MRASIIFLILIFSYGCDLSGGGGSIGDVTLGVTFKPINEYTSFEKSIATKICYAFQSKRSNFVTNFDGDLFRFDLELSNIDCQSAPVEYKRIETTLIAKNFSTLMFFDSLDAANEFERKIETNAHGHLVDICNQVMTGQMLPSPTTIVGNSAREVISFFENQNDTGFIYKLYKRDWTADFETYLLNKYDYLTILVDSTQEKYGITLERKFEEQCSGGIIQKKTQFYLP